MVERAKIPADAKILIELGCKRPDAVPYDPIVPFEMLWVVTNGKIRRKFLWVTYRNTGIYVALGTPNSSHASYHSDGTYHWKTSTGQVIAEQRRQAFGQLSEPVVIQNGTVKIQDDALENFEMREFQDHPVDSVLYLDNRVLPPYIAFHVYAVPPFRQGDIPLINDWPASLHIVTQTNPWIAVVLYEQTNRPERPKDAGGLVVAE
ncbi:MAG: hypothetical protein CXZ00_08150 [Acidobacteria bacterium]|nr:MAG: hypothetical protein CXZ00_08150 [Acidobacteriota bacterium]